MSDTTRDALPPLPEAAMVETNPYGECGTLEWYDADQMREYGKACIAAFAQAVAQRINTDTGEEVREVRP